MWPPPGRSTHCPYPGCPTDRQSSTVPAGVRQAGTRVASTRQTASRGRMDARSSAQVKKTSLEPRALSCIQFSTRALRG